MKFYLIHPSKPKTSIFADVNFRKFRYRTSINIVLKSAHWDNRNQKVRSINGDYGKINARLKFIRSQIDTFLTDVKINKRALSFDDFKYSVDSIISPDIFVGKPNPNDNVPLIKHLEYFIEKKEKQKALREATLDKYKNLASHLSKFSNNSVREYFPKDMNQIFYDSFMHYLLIKKNMVNNSAGTVIKCLKAFLNSIAKEGVDVNLSYKDFKALKDSTHMAIALTDEELVNIEQLKLKNKQLINTRDLLFIQLHSAQRVSDLMRFRKEHIDFNDRTIKITQLKTGNKVVLPLTEKVIEVFEKYKYKLPVMDKSSYNKNLKKLCKSADINEIIEIIKPQGHLRQVITKPKYSLVSSHTIRRTAITLLLRKGVLPEYVMKVSGIRSYEVFQKYIKLTQEEAAAAVRDLWDKV